MTDELKYLILSSIERFEKFENEWAEYRAENKELTHKIAELHATVQMMAPHASHLSQLPLIASSLRGLETQNASHINNLIGSANSSEQQKTKLIERMMLICLVTVIFLGVLLIVLLVRETRSSVTIGAGGLKINTSEATDAKTIERRPNGS